LVFLVASFPLDFPPTIYTRSSSPPFHATCPAQPSPSHLILLVLIILIILCEENKSWSYTYIYIYTYTYISLRFRCVVRLPKLLCCSFYAKVLVNLIRMSFYPPSPNKATNRSIMNCNGRESGTSV
jgi:hypothetical protein